MNHDKIPVGKISYINASPVYYGLDHGLVPTWMEMVPEVPCVLNQKIIAGQVKVSPISAAFYAMNHKELVLLPDLSISCHGRVLSVILASHFPIDELNGKKVVFSVESASAASFLKMIFRKKNIFPDYHTADVSNGRKISSSCDAVLVIGDTALINPWNDMFEFCIDLGQLWYDMNQMPFVFAVWAVKRSFAEKFPDIVGKIHGLLLESRAEGYLNIDRVIDAGQKKLNLERSFVRKYFDLLYCDLDDRKIKAMAMFFDSLLEQGVLDDPAEIEFFKP